MFDSKSLKEKNRATKDTVDCPVKDCAVKLVKMRRGVPRLLDSYLERGKPDPERLNFEGYFCKNHGIFVTPSTFIYDNYRENCLWKDEESLGLLEAISDKKRVKAQFFHDNSEDAVTWNVFRFLEKNHLVDDFLSLLAGSHFNSSEIIYWSYSQEEKSTWSWLEKARNQFGEEDGRGSEPDVIIKTDKALFFIEAKLTSGNKTVPSDRNNAKKYETGGDGWFEKVFNSDFRTVALAEEKYELMRFWLLGTWIAKELGLDLWLVNLVLKGKEEGIEAAFKKHIKDGPNRHFKRATWEEIYEFISNHKTKDAEAMLGFFKNKTLGYSGGRLKKAFSIVSK